MCDYMLQRGSLRKGRVGGWGCWGGGGGGRLERERERERKRERHREREVYSCSLLSSDVCFPTPCVWVCLVYSGVVSLVVNVVTYYVSDLTFIFSVTFRTLYVNYKECVPAVLLEVLSTCKQ